MVAIMHHIHSHLGTKETIEDTPQQSVFSSEFILGEQKAS